MRKWGKRCYKFPSTRFITNFYPGLEKNSSSSAKDINFKPLRFVKQLSFIFSSMFSRKPNKYETVWERTGFFVRHNGEFDYLFRPPTRIWRSGQSLERAMAVEPPTRPVPPRTSTREFRVFSGSWTLFPIWASAELLLGEEVTAAVTLQRLTLLFKCIYTEEAPAIILSLLYHNSQNPLRSGLSYQFLSLLMTWHFVYLIILIWFFNWYLSRSLHFILLD